MHFVCDINEFWANTLKHLMSLNQKKTVLFNVPGSLPLLFYIIQSLLSEVVHPNTGSACGVCVCQVWRIRLRKCDSTCLWEFLLYFELLVNFAFKWPVLVSVAGLLSYKQFHLHLVLRVSQKLLLWKIEIISPSLRLLGMCSDHIVPWTCPVSVWSEEASCMHK